ncbi:MAG TPA: hypothetical protein VGE45_07525 [Chloroflexia bacterium]|jgi:hypothetical protein
MKTPDTTKQQLAICIRNDGYPVSLEVRKVYRVVSDTGADEHHFIRVLDESGESYLYPSEYFILVDLPDDVREAIFITA